MLDLFSGIGGMSLAADWAGVQTVAFCEIEPYCQKVLKRHWPCVPIYDDVRKLTKKRLKEDGVIDDERTIDIVAGGYPCQPFSVAGKRRGTEDDRHLWPEMFRIVRELRPTWVVGENVAGHVSLGLDDVLSDLESEGYQTRAFVLPALAVGAPHRRDRVFVVAYTESQQDRRREQFWIQPNAGAGGQNVAYSGAERLPKKGTEQQATRVAGSSKNVANVTSKGLERQQWTEHEGGRIRFINGSKRSTQSFLGRGFDGFSKIMDRIVTEKNWSWPAAFGEEQYEWEPPRVINGAKNRVPRLKALGNAVVPQQVYPIFKAIAEIETS